MYIYNIHRRCPRAVVHGDRFLWGSCPRSAEDRGKNESSSDLPGIEAAGPDRCSSQGSKPQSVMTFAAPPSKAAIEGGGFDAQPT